MLFILIALAMLLLIFAVAAFIWASRNGQFDDLDGPAWDILLDNDEHPAPPATASDKHDEPD